MAPCPAPGSQAPHPGPSSGLMAPAHRVRKAEWLDVSPPQPGGQAHPSAGGRPRGPTSVDIPPTLLRQDKARRAQSLLFQVLKL